MQRRRNRGLELGVVLLITEIMNVGFDQIPPVTLCTIAGQVMSTVTKIEQNRHLIPLTSNTVTYSDNVRSLCRDIILHIQQRCTG
jgi:hypothetical protein